MLVTRIHRGPVLSVFTFRCTAKPGDKPYPEIHRNHALAYVRRGSFGCGTLVRRSRWPGAGRPGTRRVSDI